MVQNEVLEKVDGKDVTAFVVWIPTFPGDNRGKALRARNLVPDARARHFWDGKLELGKRYRGVLSLPEGIEVAWDVYFVFGPDAEWKESPPAPGVWQHQLFGADKDRRLNGDSFLNGVLGLLQAKPSRQE